MRALILAASLTCGCYQSHPGLTQPADTDGVAGAPASEVVPSVPEPDVSVPEAVSHPPQQETPKSVVAASGSEVANGDSGGALPILYRAEPGDSCSNKDLWITLAGESIHWDSTVTLVYPYHDARLAFGADDQDSCGRRLVDWGGLDRISFRTHPGAVWEGMSGYVSGYYLVHVTGPDGAASNSVGLNLQWCGDTVGEVLTDC